MLINCPRCGFSQPKDHYCASCGVNIDKFKPQKTSLVEKALSSTLLQVLIVISIALTSAYFALNSQKRSTNKILQPSRSTVQSKQQISEISSNESAVTVELASEGQQLNLTGQSNSQPKIITQSPSTNNSNAKNDLTNKHITLKYSFYEIDRVLLNYWIQLNLNQYPNDDSSTFKIGEISLEQIQKQIKFAPLKTETKKVNLIEKVNFSAGLERENSDSYVGFISEFNLTSISDLQLIGFIRLMKKTRLGSEVLKIPLSIKKQNTFFIHLKNDLTGFENESGLTQIPPFQILKSPRFLDRKTELVVIIEPFF